MSDNGIKYVPWKIFCWITGIIITVFMVSYGYLYTQNQDAIQRVQANTVMITRLEERISSILDTVVEIKDILKER